uniref:Uncharacterized protein n=1 Tax=Trichogramma kaykai TaxID=54128 RepID=A0ABD2X518_9HYME
MPFRYTVPSIYPGSSSNSPGKKNPRLRWPAHGVYPTSLDADPSLHFACPRAGARVSSARKTASKGFNDEVSVARRE